MRILSKEIFPKCNESLEISLFFNPQIFIFLVLRCTIFHLK